MLRFLLLIAALLVAPAMQAQDSGASHELSSADAAFDAYLDHDFNFAADASDADSCGGQAKPSCMCSGGPGGYPYNCAYCGDCYGGPGGYRYDCWKCPAN